MKTEELVKRVRALSGKVNERKVAYAEKKADKIDPKWEECIRRINNLPNDPLEILRTAEQQPKIFDTPKYKRYELNRVLNGFDVQMIVYEDLDGFGVKKSWYVAFNDDKNTSYMRVIGV